MPWRISPKIPAHPALEIPADVRYDLKGFLGQRLKAAQENWLLPFPEANPNVFQIFRDRDRHPRPRVEPWAGEYPGKFLIGALQCWRLTRDTRLRRMLDQFVNDLIAVQDADGYLGPHPRSERLTGRACPSENRGDFLEICGIWGGPLWDLWGHYHCMLGLLTWYEQTGCLPALQACQRAADFVCARFLDTGERVSQAGEEEKNATIVHVFLLLYRHTGEPRYLHMARQIEREWETPPAGDYVRMALAGQEFFENRKPRWESLPDVQAIAQFYYVTGQERYRQAFEHLWGSILRHDRHNTGGFSSGERAQGNPFDPRPIETCCTVAWMALSVDMLHLTADPSVADELELSTFNATLGSQHPSGRWWTYNTPMDGERRAFVHDFNWQCRPGGPELNCCQANAARGLGMLSEWALLPATDGDGYALNYYGESKISVRLARGRGRVDFVQDTSYPLGGQVMIRVGLREPARFTLRLRIPQWSYHTGVALNGQPLDGATAGTYLALDRTWTDGDRIALSLDMSLHFWPGDREYKGLTSIYRGPILLAYDQRFNCVGAGDMLPLDSRSLQLSPVKWERKPAPWLLFECPTQDGHSALLCDFASAGVCGTPYRSWLPVKGVDECAVQPGACAWTARLRNR